MTTTTADATSHTLADHHPIGISTGVFEPARGDWPALVDEACRVSTFAVELSALSGAELPGLVRYLLAKPRLPFRYVSVHAPVKHQGSEAPVLVQQLAELPVWVRSIVAHPDAISNPDAYGSLGTRLVLENMDDRKATGRTADEIEPFFEELPDAGFCLDVAHAWSIDPTMTVARCTSRARKALGDRSSFVSFHSHSPAPVREFNDPPPSLSKLAHNNKIKPNCLYEKPGRFNQKQRLGPLTPRGGRKTRWWDGPSKRTEPPAGERCQSVEAASDEHRGIATYPTMCLVCEWRSTVSPA